SIDAEHVKQFNAEVDQASARPIYFFDAKGDRPGTLWYLRRLTVDHVKADPETATREAKELGLDDQKFWNAALAYLKVLDAAKTLVNPSSTPAPEPTPPKPDAPKVPDPPAPAPKSDAGRSAATGPEAGPRPAEPAAPRDPAAWRPYAAL